MRTKGILILSLVTGLATAGKPAGLLQGIRHTLFGDVTVEDVPPGQSAPMSFQVILYSRPGHVISRQAVSNNGRYRFLSVANGEYYIAVEQDGQEVGRMLVNLGEPRSTDVRQDITLRWSAKAPSIARPGTVRAYDRDSGNARLFERAEEHLKKKEYDKALPLLREIVNADPKDYIAWTELGSAYVGKQDVTAAESAYATAVEVNPSFVLASINLGKLRMTNRNYETASEVLAKAVESNPNCAECHLLLGECYLQVKKGSKAVVHLGEAIKLDPAGMADAHLRLAALYNAAGMRDKAALEYEKFLKKRPDYAEKDRLKKYIAENKKL